MAGAETGLSLEDLLLYPPSQQLYVLDHQVPDGDGAVEALCAVLLKRDHGFLLGVPRGLLADSEISAGFVAPMEAPLGPSTVVECPAAILQGGALTAAPGRVVSMTLLDVSAELAQILVPFEAEEPYELLVSFDPASPELVPEPAAALSLALTWIQDPSVEALDRVTFYSADEAPQAVPAKKPRPRLHLSRADMAAQAPPLGTTAAEPVQKPKKPSVAGLAVQMETLMGILPGLSARIDGMDQRTQEIANLVTTGAAAPLRRPLSDGLGATAKAQPPALARLGPPPSARAPPQRPQTAAEDEALEAADLEQDPVPSDTMAQAMLAQSQALTSLLQQLPSTHADPVLDLGGAGSAGVRGASQRAKMQEELAMGRGTFFKEVLQNLARRMAPSQITPGSPQAMLDQGLSLSRYWERFGGWANARDMSLVAYQVGLIFDALMCDRYELAKDHVALLAVSLEQASLDGARMDIGFQLTWLEEPPSSLYLPRTTGLARGRSFAPRRRDG